MKKFVLILAVCLLVSAALSGCASRGEETTPVTTIATAPATEAETMATEAETLPAETEPRELLTKAYDREKVCLRLQPTLTTTAGDDGVYYIPENQTAWLAAYEAAVEKAELEQAWKPEDRSSGIMVRCQDAWWELLESGDLMGSGSGRIAAEDAAELVELCREAAQMLELGAPVRPEQIQNLRSATLEFNGSHTVTDSAVLDRIAALLSGAKEIRGGAACWFTGLLTLELESGETLTISMATDSCATWLSEGVYYDYGSGIENEEFFSYFGVDIYAQ